MESFNKKVLLAAGVSTSIIAAASVLAVGFFIYKTYMDAQLTRLQIRQLKREEALAL